MADATSRTASRTEQRRAPFALVATWAVVFAASFLPFVLMEAEDMGFTRGMNRVWPFLIGQVIALIFAVAAWARGRGTWLGRVPLMVMGLELAALAAVIAYTVATN
jgi:hypothetical protein